MKIARRTPELTRQRVVNPHLDLGFKDLLTRARCLDLRGNWTFEDHGGGYARAVAANPSRRWGDSTI